VGGGEGKEMSIYALHVTCAVICCVVWYMCINILIEKYSIMSSVRQEKLEWLIDMYELMYAKYWDEFG